MPDLRKTLTLDYSNGSRIFILKCNKSEKKSFLRHYHNDGNSSWLPETVAVKHNDGKPKILHISIPVEGIYEIFEQPYLRGLYCIYKALNGVLYYAEINKNEKTQLIDAFNKGISFRDTLVGMGKRNIF